MTPSFIISWLDRMIFSHRRWVVAFFIIVTIWMAYFITQLRIDAGFSKMLPLNHEYMKTYREYQKEFGGANRILIALMTKQGDIFTSRFFDLLKDVTDDVFFIPGVDRTKVQSLFTPNVRFTEVVEDGIAGGNIIPADFRSTPECLKQVRKNILKSNILGRLVANDFTGAIVSAELLEFHPNTGERLDYIKVAHILEEKIRSKYEQLDINDEFDIHIIGFTKMIGDIADGAARMVLFFVVTFLITALLVYIYAQSFRLTVIPLATSLMAVVWQMGLLSMLGFGIDPMAILVPFLVFAIGVSHGVQMVSSTRAELLSGEDSFNAARKSFYRLIIPGSIALVTDTIGFITILFIRIRMIQELAITASLGVAAIILTNLFLIPVLMSYVKFDDVYRKRITKRTERLELFWRSLARVSHRRISTIVIIIALGLLVFGIRKATDIKIGDLHRGVPELRANSQYNIDTKIISDRFSIGVDIISVIVETVPEACVNYDVMTTIDEFEWHMRNLDGVQTVIGLPGIAKVINAAWNEGSLKWRVLPRNQQTLAQSISCIPTSSGLLNTDCSVMPVYIFTRDHRAENISDIVSEVKRFSRENGSEKVNFRLASGNVGVMAATNEEVDAAQFPILLYLFLAIILLCLITFRSIRSTLCIILPLGLVSLLAYALMSILQIGLKVSTLPVVALGVGIGVDYSIYIYSRLEGIMASGESLQEAYRHTLRITGSGVLFTGLTLAIGVITWIFSPLKFQADMGILLTFMFLVNMLSAVILLPALASKLLKG